MRDLMIRQQRAKQFQPFDAMKGLNKALKDREERHNRIEKREISEEAVKEIEAVLLRVEKDIKIRVAYYKAFHYFTIKGAVDKIDKVNKFLLLGEEKIFFDDIYEIRILDY